MACIGEAKLRDTSNPTVLEATEGGEKKLTYIQCKREQDPFSWQQPRVITAQLGQQAAGFGLQGKEDRPEVTAEAARTC